MTLWWCSPGDYDISEKDLKAAKYTTGYKQTNKKKPQMRTIKKCTNEQFQGGDKLKKQNINAVQVLLGS